MKQTWDPNQYNKFKNQRAKPFYDLMEMLQPVQFQNAIDLGCGTGELTRQLFDKVKPAKMAAIDSSEEMLLGCEKFKTTNLEFKLENIANHQPEKKSDLLFSNAALQWLPNHETLFPKILNWLEVNGQVAIQMPFNFDHPSHSIAKDIAIRLFPNVFNAKKDERSLLSLERYAEIFFQNGYQDQCCKIQVYAHPMNSGEDVVEWTKGTLLTQYQAKLSPNDFDIFLNEYRKELFHVIGSGPYFYAFKRALLWGRRS